MEGRSALFALAPLCLALLALLAREATRPERSVVTVEGRAQEIVTPPLLAAALPGERGSSWRVAPDRSSARVAVSDGGALDLGVSGSLRVGSDGALVDVDLGLAPCASRGVDVWGHVSGGSTPFAPSAVPIVGSARGALRLEGAGATSAWNPALTWMQRSDGSAACLLAGELSSDELGLPRPRWSRILHFRRPAWLALELSLEKDDQ